MSAEEASGQQRWVKGYRYLRGQVVIDDAEMVYWTGELNDIGPFRAAATDTTLCQSRGALRVACCNNGELHTESRHFDRWSRLLIDNVSSL